jgi:hypothetical protein
MNRQNIKQRLRRRFFALAIAGALTVGAALTLPKAEAGKPSDKSYGPGALYQIELVSGDNGASFLPVGQRGAPPQGGGIWLWIALYPNGDADYAGSDCIDGVGSFADRGDATWAYSGGSLVISGVQLYGLQTFFPDFHTVITVPAVYGHYTGTVGTFMTLPDVIPPDSGMSLVQVAGGAPGTTTP